MRSRAHVELLGTGPRSAMICERCEIREEYPRTEPAKDAARTHNRDHHPDTQGAC
jgi:hypothetical protein